jgi:hypothetical protein
MAHRERDIGDERPITGLEEARPVKPALRARLSERQVAAAITLLAHLIAKASAWRAVPDTTPMTTEVRGDE